MYEKDSDLDLLMNAKVMWGILWLFNKIVEWFEHPEDVSGEMMYTKMSFSEIIYFYMFTVTSESIIWLKLYGNYWDWYIVFNQTVRGTQNGDRSELVFNA